MEDSLARQRAGQGARVCCALSKAAESCKLIGVDFGVEGEPLSGIPQTLQFQSTPLDAKPVLIGPLSPIDPSVTGVHVCGPGGRNGSV